MKRRLAAILVADVVGYSRLMQRDEEATLVVLRKRRKQILDPIVRSHKGRIVKVMGDGVLIEFASAVHAVQAALALQDGFGQANDGVPQDRQIVLRIGINLGDVIGEGQDIYGDSVNIAARMEALAEPGGICISAKVHAEVARKIDCAFEDIGLQSVKNISPDIHAFRVHPSGQDRKTQTPKVPLNPPLPNRPSIAVLPFQNMSADAEQEYFADGMVEDIITELSRSKGLFVIARNSSFVYKGRAVDIKEVGRELGVRYVLEGSVRRAGDRLRITGQLIDAANGAHIWADKFDGDMTDVFDLQDRITSSVVGTIAPKLEQAEIARNHEKPTEIMDAYDHYLRGMAAFNTFTREGNALALEHFGQALAFDPAYAAACGMMARCYGQRVGFGWLLDPDAERAEALALARRAAKLGPDDAVALSTAGFALMCFHQIDEGDALIDRAVDLNPNLAWPLIVGGMCKALGGDGATAVSRAELAVRLSPQDPQLFGIHIAAAIGHWVLGDYVAAMKSTRITLQHQPNFKFGLAVQAASAALSDQPKLASAAIERLRRIDPDLRVRRLNQWLVFARPELMKLWCQALEKAGLPH